MASADGSTSGRWAAVGQTVSRFRRGNPSGLVVERNANGQSRLADVLAVKLEEVVAPVLLFPSTKRRPLAPSGDTSEHVAEASVSRSHLELRNEGGRQADDRRPAYRNAS
jgi:hypothetical protein